jgi:hypothetical protein
LFAIAWSQVSPCSSTKSIRYRSFLFHTLSVSHLHSLQHPGSFYWAKLHSTKTAATRHRRIFTQSDAAFCAYTLYRSSLLRLAYDKLAEDIGPLGAQPAAR